MKAYIARRILLLIPTLLGILLINFIIAQLAPGGPVEQMLAKFEGHDTTYSSQLGGEAQSDVQTLYNGSSGIDEDLIEELKQQFGFDKPAYERFALMVWNYARFDFGYSFYRDEKVSDILLDKLPVSISLGLWTMLVIYLVAIPLGIRKAIKAGSRFDAWTSLVLIVAYAVPAFLLAIFLIVLLCGGNFLDLFPLKGLVSDNWESLSWPARIRDYLWHIFLPVLTLSMGGIASLSMLTRNSFLEEIRKQYVMTAEAKGLTESRVLYGHVFRNAMLIVIAGFPSAFVGIFFTGAILIENIFSLDGLGLLGYEAAFHRDYPIVFGTLFIMTLLTLALNILSDIMYVIVDPRIHFESHD